MDTSQILSALREERARLDKAIAALEGLDINGASPARKGRPKTAGKKRHLSAAARKRLSELLKKRWASGKMKRAKSKAA